ncbi:MAG: hypothetical protein WBD47_03700 [Phormidesmis sp.]
MQSFREKPVPSLLPESLSLPLAVDLVVSLSTLPFLGLITAGHIAQKELIQLGQASEELFRGDRLPILPPIETQSRHSSAD